MKNCLKYRSKYYFLTALVLHYFLSLFTVSSIIFVPIENISAQEIARQSQTAPVEAPRESEGQEESDQEPVDDTFEVEELYWTSLIVIPKILHSYDSIYVSPLFATLSQRQFRPPKV